MRGRPSHDVVRRWSRADIVPVTLSTAAARARAQRLAQQQQQQAVASRSPSTETMTSVSSQSRRNSAQPTGQNGLTTTFDTGVVTSPRSTQRTPVQGVRSGRNMRHKSDVGVNRI
jgi:hypothetical protein